MNATESFIAAVGTRKPSATVDDAFKKMVSEKVKDALDVRRIALTAEIYNTPSSRNK